MDATTTAILTITVDATAQQLAKVETKQHGVDATNLLKFFILGVLYKQHSFLYILFLFVSYSIVYKLIKGGYDVV